MRVIGMSRRTGRSGILEAPDCAFPVVVCALNGAAPTAMIVVREIALRNRAVIKAPEDERRLATSG
jgi:hypothetical protein